MLVFVILSSGAYAAACNVQGEVFDVNGNAVGTGATVECTLYRSNGLNSSYATVAGTGFPPFPSFYHRYKCDMDCDAINEKGDIVRIIAHDSGSSGSAYSRMRASTMYINVTLGQTRELEEAYSGKESDGATSGGMTSADKIEVVNASYDYNLTTRRIIFNIIIENKLDKSYEHLSTNFILKDLKGKTIIDFTDPIALGSFEKKEVRFYGQGFLEVGTYTAEFLVYDQDTLIQKASFEVYISHDVDEALPETEQPQIIFESEEIEEPKEEVKAPKFFLFLIIIIIILLIIYYWYINPERRNKRGR